MLCKIDSSDSILPIPIQVSEFSVTVELPDWNMKMKKKVEDLELKNIK